MNSLLLIDDKNEFKDAFQTRAQNKGYKLAWGRSFDYLKEHIPTLHRKITAVVLDIKCLMKDDDPIEKSTFIGSALTFLNTHYPDLPRVILTGDEHAFDNFSKIFDTEHLFKKDPEDIDKLFQKIEEYNHQHEERLKSLDEKEFYKIIEDNEGNKLEFKSSLQYSTKENVEDKALRFEVLKTLAAFANTNGGTLLIGVKDDKTIYGLENGDFTTINKENKIDAYRLLIDELIEQNFGNGFHAQLYVKFYNVNEKSICRITIKGKSNMPIHIKRKQENKRPYEAFFIRAQASTREIKDEQKEQYIRETWK